MQKNIDTCVQLSDNFKLVFLINYRNVINTIINIQAGMLKMLSVLLIYKNIFFSKQHYLKNIYFTLTERKIMEEVI